MLRLGKKTIITALGTVFSLFLCAVPPPLTILYKPDGTPERYAGKVFPGKVFIPAQYRQPSAEMRGVWIATVENIDFPRQSSISGFQAAVRSKFRQLRAQNFNAVFFDGHIETLNAFNMPTQYWDYDNRKHPGID